MMPARQALPEPLWGSEFGVACARQNDQAFYLNHDELFRVRGTWEGHNLGNAALPLRALLQGLRLQSVCVPYSRQLGNMSFLERKFGRYNSISGLG